MRGLLRPPRRTWLAPALTAVAVMLAARSADAGVTPPAVREGNIILQQGDPVGLSTAATMNPPYVNDAGEVAFSGLMADGDNYVYIGGGVAWRESLLAGVGQDVGRDSYFGYNIAIGGKNQVGPVQIVLGIRWLLLMDTAFDPSSVNLGLSVPLWNARPGPQR